MLWAATAMSNIGDGLRRTTLPLLAMTVTTDPRLIAGVVVADQLPWLIFILPGGAWADRFDRRRMRMWLDVARTVVMLALVGLVVVDRVSIGAIYVIAAILASAEAVVDSSSMALVPAMVDEPDLERAGGLLFSTELATNHLIGPPLGGLLFSVAMVVPFIIDAASFAGAALIMALVSGTYAASTREARQSSMRYDIVEGFRWFWHRRLLRRLAVISTAMGTLSFVGGAIFVLFARETLRLSPFGFGLLLVPGAIGGIAGSMLAHRLTNLSLRIVLSLVISIYGIATWVLSAMSAPVFVGCLLALSAAAVMVWNVLTLALRQRVIPNDLLGRVGASYRFLVHLGKPIGALAGGFIANGFGIRTTLAISGIGLTIIGLLVPFLLRDQLMDDN